MGVGSSIISKSICMAMPSAPLSPEAIKMEDTTSSTTSGTTSETTSGTTTKMVVPIKKGKPIMTFVINPKTGEKLWYYHTDDRDKNGDRINNIHYYIENGYDEGDILNLIKLGLIKNKELKSYRRINHGVSQTVLQLARKHEYQHLMYELYQRDCLYV